jgi:hypothetical protein
MSSMSFQINFSLIIISVSAVIAEILTLSNTPQTRKHSVTIAFKHYLYANKHNPNTTATTNPTSANTTATLRECI